VSDRIILRNIRLEGRHGYNEEELETPQPFEVDVELILNLQPAGIDDDLEQSVDYARVYDIVRQVVESTSYRLLEALAEAISHEILAAFPVVEVGVRVRKPAVKLSGPLDYAGVEVWRRPVQPSRGRPAAPRGRRSRSRSGPRAGS
jgi:7,8-dihydroneopterin aldolase/epimerase/oxygenase